MCERSASSCVLVMHAVWWRTTTLWKSFLRPASSCRNEEERGWGFSGYKVTHTRMLGGKFASSLFLPSHRDDGNVCILSLKNSTIFTARATFVLLPAFSSSFSVCRRRHGVRELSHMLPLPIPPSIVELLLRGGKAFERVQFTAT